MLLTDIHYTQCIACRVLSIAKAAVVFFLLTQWFFTTLTRVYKERNGTCRLAGTILSTEPATLGVPLAAVLQNVKRNHSGTNPST
jgi:hypothetical protein